MIPNVLARFLLPSLPSIRSQYVFKASYRRVLTEAAVHIKRNIHSPGRRYGKEGVSYSGKLSHSKTHSLKHWFSQLLNIKDEQQETGSGYYICTKTSKKIKQEIFTGHWSHIEGREEQRGICQHPLAFGKWSSQLILTYPVKQVFLFSCRASDRVISQGHYAAKRLRHDVTQ